MPLPKRIKKDHYYNYKEYYSWGEGYFCELIDGKVIERIPEWMQHQKAVNTLMVALPRGFYYRIDVRLYPKDDESDGTVVNPDFTWVTDKKYFGDGRAFLGVPEVLIEILSPFTQELDRYTKLNLYLEAGVREYWLVDPESQAIQVFERTEKGYTPQAYEISDTLRSPTFPGLEITLSDIFPNE